MPTPTELWRYQGGGSVSTDFIYGVSVATDGSVFLTGASSGNWTATSEGDYDFSAAKLDSDGNLLWAWQEGSEGDDRMKAAAAVEDGGVVVVGYFSGTWKGVTAEGDDDFAAVKLDSDRTVKWRWQTGTVYEDRLDACVTTTDGNVVVAGHSEGSLDGTASAGYRDIVAVKLNVSSGDELWTYQAGKLDTAESYAYAATARADGSVVLAGATFGAFHTPLSTTDGDADFAAVAIDESGTELWRWQDGPTSGSSAFTACTALGDGSVILGGYTEGNWSGINKGEYDFAAVKLNASGQEEWRWQDGTAFEDQWAGAATTIDGSIVLAGYTYGNWAGTEDIRLDEERDFAAMAMDDEGLKLLWSYQNGTDDADDLNAVAVGPDGSILLAGWTDGTWTTPERGDPLSDYAVVSIDGGTLTTPSPETTTPPTGTPSAPSLPPTLPTPVPQSVPATAEMKATPGPLSVTPSTSYMTPRPSSGPISIEAVDSPSSSNSSAFIIGGTVAGAIVLVILGVLAYRRSGGNAAAKTSNPMEPRQLPFAARANGPMPPPPSYPQMIALRS